MGKRRMFVLRRAATATEPAAYYPPRAEVRAQWSSAAAAKQDRDSLRDAAAWQVVPTHEARGLDRRDAEAARRVEIRRVMEEEADRYGLHPIDETPGDLMSYPMFNGRVGGDSTHVDVPIVAIRRITEGLAHGTVVKMPDGAITHLPPDWALEDEAREVWLEHLAKWRAGGYSYVREKSR